MIIINNSKRKQKTLLVMPKSINPTEHLIVPFVLVKAIEKHIFQGW